MKDTATWFNTWFDSPYYHLLYKHRDDNEAKAFIDRLHLFFGFKSSDKILDLACGKGRHAIYLNKLGMEVAGVDLSPHNIQTARQFENDRLHFHIHDMRSVFMEDTFDYVLNLFTSFGYFDTTRDNEKVVAAAARALKKGGKLLIDFLNPAKVIHQLVPCEEKEIEGILFKITKQYSKGYIIKDISFEDQGKAYAFQEKVKAIPKDEFMHYFAKANLKLLHILGDYKLQGFDINTSERMIFILEK